ncbi:MAG: TIGR03089 family protein [Nocardioides sp.]
MPSPTTFPALLADQLRRDAARPLVTFYDDATGERVELSVTTYANWVAKTAGLAQDELDVERGGLVLVDLPTHWLGAVWLGAAWSLGLRVTDDRGRVDEADLVVCGPESVDELAPAAARVPVVALSLRPLGARFDVPLPTGVVDYGAVVLGQPDVFMPLDPPEGDDVGWTGPDGDVSQGDLLRSGVAGLEDGGRLLTDVNPCRRDGLATLVAPLAAGGGTVWVRHPDEGSWARRYDAERASVELRA